MQSQNYQWVGDRPRGPRRCLTTGAVVLIVLWTLNWSAQGAQLSLGELVAGLPQIGDFLSRTFPRT